MTQHDRRLADEVAAVRGAARSIAEPGHERWAGVTSGPADAERGARALTAGTIARAL